MSPRHGLVDLRPLRTSAAFRRIWAGSSLTALGQQVTVVAVLFQVWELTGSPVWTGAIGIAHAVPLVVFADRWVAGRLGGPACAGQVDHRCPDPVRARLAWQAVEGLESLAVVLALVAVQAACGALGLPARRTFASRLLPREQVPAGIALQHLSFQGAMLVGPALAGLVIARWGLTACYLLDAATFVASLYSVIRMPAMPPLGLAHRGGAWAIVDGWRLIAARPVLRGSFATDLVATVLAMPIALFPVINEIRFGGDPETLGLFLSAVAVGGITAGVLSGAVTRARRTGVVQLGAATLWGLALAGFGLTEPLWLALSALAVAGAADTVSVVSRAAMVQLATPDSHRGRVSSVENIIGMAGPHLGNFRGGLVAGVSSASFALVSGGVLAIAGSNGPLRRFRLADHQE